MRIIEWFKSLLDNEFDEPTPHIPEPSISVSAMEALESRMSYLETRIDILTGIVEDLDVDPSFEPPITPTAEIPESEAIWTVLTELRMRINKVESTYVRSAKGE